MDIRTIEREIVDQHHRSLRVWRRPQSAIVWGVLRNLGQLPRDFWSPDVPDTSVINLWRVFNEFQRGAAQAIRWAAQSDATEYDWFPENEQILDETIELLKWAIDYAQLAACFVAWTRKTINAQLDAASRRVQFTFDGDVGAPLIAADLKETERGHLTFVRPVNAVRGLLALDTEEDWLAAGQWPHERPKLTGHPAFAGAVKWARQVLMPELEDAISVGPFDLSDLRRFWATIWLVSASYAISEDDLDQRTRHRNELPAAVLCMTRDQWIRRLAAVTGASQERITTLLDLMTFDPSTLHSSLASHPFVATRSGSVFLSPRLVYHCDPRSLVGWILNARPELREAYGALNQRLQHHWIEKLGNAFRMAGWNCWTERRFRSGRVEITPDIVACDRDRRVLVADFKHTTPPIEPRQVTDRLKSFDADCDQVRRYERVLREHPEMLTSIGIRDHPKASTVALIYRWPLAIPYALTSQVSVLHAERILSKLNAGATTLAQLLTSSIAVRSAQAASREIRVAEWTFVTPGIEFDA